MNNTLEGLEQQLRARLEHLGRRAGLLEGALRGPHDDDSQERATEVENDEVLQRLDDATRQEVIDIRQTLHRIATGTYGICERCHRPIGRSRLNAVPTAPACIDCASQS